MVKTSACPGDYVEVHLMHKIYEGLLLESPQDEKDVVLFKLNNGYNIGLNKKDIIEIKVKKKYSPIVEKFETKSDEEKPNIGMVMVGGTISSQLDSKTGAVKWLTSPEKLFQFYPEVFKHANVSRIESPFKKDSGEMDFKDWKEIAKSVDVLLKDDNIKGVIVTHGTDSLHYTATALSFFLRDLNKPVVLTYSQRSTDRASSDASLNLECASLVAVSDIAEVVLVGHADTNDDFCYVLRGTKVRKMHSSRRDAFRPINTKPIAKVFPNKMEILSSFNPVRKENKKVYLDNKFEGKIALIKYFPGQDPDILDYFLKKGCKGVVIEFMGLGQIAAYESRNNWIPKLKEVQKKGMFICATAQTIYGRLNPKVYSTGRELLKTGVVYLGDMHSETALVKLGWVLGHTDWASSNEKIREKMLENISGEFNDRLEE
ncbi:Glu-tRNA(Gln) amidotransferase subunit GatD [Candidatus Pacearchaeota archaeon]|nr:Glu-tRNA(Gln) amidotransferase subunit GatD [Candidatus Pacearchaeota archaeon]